MKQFLGLFAVILALALPMASHAQTPYPPAPWCGPKCVQTGSYSGTAFSPVMPLAIPPFVTQINAAVIGSGVTGTYTIQIQTSATGVSWTNCGSSFTVAANDNNSASCSWSTTQPWGYVQITATGGTGTFTWSISGISSLVGDNATFLGGYPVSFTSPASGNAVCFGTAVGGGLDITNGGCSGGGTGITDLTSTGSTLTVTNGTGPTANAEINLANPNTWTGTQTFVAPVLGTPASGVISNLTGTCTACTANAAASATNLSGGATGSAPYQSAANTTGYILSPTTSGHTFVYAWQPLGSAIDPAALDLATYLSATATPISGTTITATTALVAPAGSITALGVQFTGFANIGIYASSGILNFTTNGTTRAFLTGSTFETGVFSTSTAGSASAPAFAYNGGNGMSFPTSTSVGLDANSTNVLNCTSTICSVIALEPAALNQSAASVWGGTCSMSTSTSCTITISHSFTTPVCVAAEQGTGAVAGSCGISGTTVTITAASSNSATWGALVFGDPT